MIAPLTFNIVQLVISGIHQSLVFAINALIIVTNVILMEYNLVMLENAQKAMQESDQINALNAFLVAFNALL